MSLVSPIESERDGEKLSVLKTRESVLLKDLGMEMMEKMSLLILYQHLNDCLLNSR